MNSFNNVAVNSSANYITSNSLNSSTNNIASMINGNV